MLHTNVIQSSILNVEYGENILEISFWWTLESIVVEQTDKIYMFVCICMNLEEDYVCVKFMRENYRV